MIPEIPLELTENEMERAREVIESIAVTREG